MKDWRDVLREQGISLIDVYEDVKHDILIDEAMRQAELCGCEVTADDLENIVSEFQSRYCEHEIASNVWTDVFEEYRKED